MEDRPTESTAPEAAPASAPPKGLVERVKDILLKPREEWGVIDAEASSVSSIYIGYILILAAIGPIAMVIGQQLFGWGGYGIRITPPIGYTLAAAVLTYVLQLVGVYVMALIVDALAPTFKGTKNFLKAFKVAAYCYTAIWVAAIFQIIPDLMFLQIIGLYSFYLLYLGLPRLMRVQQDQAIGYIGVVIFAQIVIYGALIMIASRIAWSLFAPTITIGGGTISL